MKYAILITRLARETQTVLVEAESEDDAKRVMSGVFKAASGPAFDDRWKPDTEWGYAEGPGSLLGAVEGGTAPEVVLAPNKIHGPQSISDDDLCSSCAYLDYRPGEDSSCLIVEDGQDWPGEVDDNSYVVGCDKFKKLPLMSLRLRAEKGSSEDD